MAIDARRQQVLRAAIVGDALGRPFNGLRHGHVLQLLGAPAEGFPPNRVLFPRKPERNVIPGIHSAGAQRLIATIAAVIPEDMNRPPISRTGATLLELAGSTEGDGMGALRGPGRPLERSIVRWRIEYPWEEAEYFAPDEASDGSSTALCGAAAACLADSDQSDYAVRLARLTHFRHLPLAVAEATRFLLFGFLAGRFSGKGAGEYATRALLDHLGTWESTLMKEHQRAWREIGWGPPSITLGQLLSALPSLVREANDDLAVRTILNTVRDAHTIHAVSHVQNGYSGAGFCWALYRGLGPMPAVLALEDVQNRGGDSALICALVAALMTARHGADCLPPEYFAGTRILSSIDALLASPTQETMARWIAAERQLSVEEERLHNDLRRDLQRQAERDAAKGRLPAARKERTENDEDEGDLSSFAPPPHLWIKPGEEEDPRKKKILKAARGKRKIDWKEERRDKNRDPRE